MNPEQRDPNRPPSDRKTRDRALVLVLVGCALLTPPLAGIFQIDARILGIPFTGLYLFVVWAALIVGAAALSGRLSSSAEWNSVENEPRSEAADDTE